LFLAPSLVQAAKIEFVTPAWNEKASVSESRAAGFSWQLEAITPAFSYSFSNPATYDPSRPMTVKISYDKASTAAKKVYVADALSGRWTPLKTSDNPVERYVTRQSARTRQISRSLCRFRVMMQLQSQLVCLRTDVCRLADI
jgi:hypothetical protein